MLAHQGGWDEILMVAVPMLVIAGLLVVARRRVVHRSAGSDTSAGTDADTRAATDQDPIVESGDTADHRTISPPG